jgi:hypothetical protein
VAQPPAEVAHGAWYRTFKGRFGPETGRNSASAATFAPADSTATLFFCAPISFGWAGTL